MPQNNKLNYYLIGITGGSASGKSLFIQTLRSRFTTEELCIISQDDYYKQLELQKKDDKGVTNFVDSIDDRQMLSDLLSLSEGVEVHRKEYLFECKDREPIIKVFKPAPVVILEGLFVFAYPEITRLADLKIFIHCKGKIRYDRRMRRDITERGIPEEKVIHQWNYHVKPAFRQYVKPARMEADLVVNNFAAMDAALEVVANHIRCKLNSKA
jgi:uridine kinase